MINTNCKYLIECVFVKIIFSNKLDLFWTISVIIYWLMDQFLNATTWTSFWTPSQSPPTTTSMLSQRTRWMPTSTSATSNTHLQPIMPNWLLTTQPLTFLSILWKKKQCPAQINHTKTQNSTLNHERTPILPKASFITLYGHQHLDRTNHLPLFCTFT